MYNFNRGCSKQRYWKWKLYITYIIMSSFIFVQILRVNKSYYSVLNRRKTDESNERVIDINGGITIHAIHGGPTIDKSIDLQNQQGTNSFTPTELKYKKSVKMTDEGQMDNIVITDKLIGFSTGSKVDHTSTENDHKQSINEVYQHDNKMPQSGYNPSSKYFIILTAPRTGSNLLSTLLSQHSHVTSYHEILNQNIFPDVFPGENIGHVANHMRANQTFLLNYIKTMLHHDWSGDRVMTGFKLFTFHLMVYNISLDSIIKTLESPKIVILHREDLIQQYVSLKIAEATEEWSRESDNEYNRSIKLSIPELQSYCQLTRAIWTQTLDSLKLYPHKIFVTYESLVEDPHKVLNSILEFFSYPKTNRKFFSFMKKQNPVDITKKISNYRDIELDLYHMMTRRLHELKFY